MSQYRFRWGRLRAYVVFFCGLQILLIGQQPLTGPSPPRAIGLVALFLAAQAIWPVSGEPCWERT